MGTLVYKIAGMDCAEEIAALRRAVGPLVGGGDQITFDLLNSKMTIAIEGTSVSPDQIVRAVSSTGMRAIPWDHQVASRTPGQAESWWSRHGRAVLCTASGVFIVLGFGWNTARTGFLSALHGDMSPPIETIVLYAAATLTGGWYVFPKAWFALRRLHADMNLLMTVAVIGAVALGEWFEAASVAFLFAVALLLETWSVGRARNAIRALMKLAPATARYRCPHDGDIEEKPVELVPVGVEVLVRPGERIPLDGIVTRDQTTVNQAAITGESTPIPKAIGDPVFAGTVNNEGAFSFRVTRAAQDTTLAKIIHMVENAQSRRAASEQWVERFARYYTPAMIVFAIMIAVIPPLFDGQWQRWFYEGLVILVIACPCALVISTPVSIVAGLATAARAGVLIKGGVYLEQAGQARAVALDKTGTLTRGELQVQRVVPVNSHTPNELLSIAASVEAHSEHPIAMAITERAKANGIALREADRFEALPGRGARAIIGNDEVWVGSHRMMHETYNNECVFHDTAEAMEDAGHSVVAVGRAGKLVGLISVADALRPDAADAVADMKRAGVAHVRMLTGDNAGTARAIAEATKVDSFASELLPEDKLGEIELLQKRYGHVAMIGDGINDAPAMAAANLGIAMAAVGSDAAIETADIALMSDDLGRVPWLMRHGRRTRWIIQQNIGFALSVKAVFMALALMNKATLWMAIAADMGASLVVIFNALRLLQDKRR